MNKSTQLQKYSSQSLEKIENRLRITDKLLNGLKPTILLIDDDETLCKINKEIFEEENYSVEYALNGFEGLRMVKLKAYNLIILGLRMPGMQGEEVLVEIKSYNSLIPVIILTACTNVETISDCSKKGADAFLSKPFAYEELLENIRKCIVK